MSRVNSFDLIRERHHAQARLLASGRSAADVAHLIGASEAQLTRQCRDPAFRQLIARYRKVETSPSPGARFQYACAA
jgi:hypothetical protein